MRRLKIPSSPRFLLRTMEVNYIRKLFILITLVLVAHHYSDFAVLSLSSSSLTVLAGSGINQAFLQITIDPMKKLKGVGNYGWGRAKRIQGGTSSVFDGSSFCTSKKNSFALYASEQEQSDLLKWENMYQEGRSSYVNDEDGEDMASPTISEVRVITFDLDNTLWKTDPVISAANNALNDFLVTRIGQLPKRVEQVMKELYVRNPYAYNPLLERDDDMEQSTTQYDGSTRSFGSPVYLTKLRIDSIKELLYNGTNITTLEIMIDDLDQIAHDAFHVWDKARHDAIPLHYADSIVETLKKLRQMRTIEGESVVIGAITDGNSDPRKVQELKDFFDFVVNAESVGVSKPNKKIYQRAIMEASRYPVVQQCLPPIDVNLHYGENEYDDDLALAGPWWVHVGDDFMKDVVPTKELKMRNIWTVELLPKRELRDPKENSVPSKKNSRRDVAELIRDIALKPVVEMTIGTTDFLIDSFESEFVDCKVSSFSNIASVITSWHTTGISGSPYHEGSQLEKISDGSYLDQTTLPTSSTDASGQVSAQRSNVADINSSTKFCINCGASIPYVAKFCFSCGEKQPEVIARG